MFANPENVKEMQAQLLDELNTAKLPPLERFNGRSAWGGSQIAEVGRRHGFLTPLSQPKVVTVFITKGGVLKTTLTMNLARLSALHGIKTVVVGLDLQGDITTALGHAPIDMDEQDLDEIFAALDSTRGLADYMSGEAGLADIFKTTDLKYLDVIPETPELVRLDQQLLTRPRREYWLLENVIEPLKQKYDLILLDCSPNWNQLITNALVAADLVLSPVECKINNYRNLQMFRALMSQFKRDMRLEFHQVFVPTRLNSQRRLSQDIYNWYREKLADCLPGAIRESIQGEEAIALHLSLVEYAAGHAASEEMKSVLRSVWGRINTPTINRSVNHGRETQSAFT